MAQGTSDATAVDGSNDSPQECDPSPWAALDAWLDVTTYQDAVIGIDSSSGDLEAGDHSPQGRTVCGITFQGGEPKDPCPNFGKVCCLLRTVCYDPPTEPDFCLRPYCH